MKGFDLDVSLKLFELQAFLYLKVNVCGDETVLGSDHRAMGSALEREESCERADLKEGLVRNFLLLFVPNELINSLTSSVHLCILHRRLMLFSWYVYSFLKYNYFF